MRTIYNEECYTLKEFYKNNKIKPSYSEFEMWLNKNGLVSSIFDDVVIATPYSWFRKNAF